jgi:hypothetical protein
VTDSRSRFWTWLLKTRRCRSTADWGSVACVYREGTGNVLKPCLYSMYFSLLHQSTLSLSLSLSLSIRACVEAGDGVGGSLTHLSHTSLSPLSHLSQSRRSLRAEERTLPTGVGIGLLKGPRGRLSLMSEVPLYRSTLTRASTAVSQRNERLGADRHAQT